MDDYVKKFAKRLYDLRDERALTLQEISETLNIGVSTLSQYENCQREPKLFNIIKLSRFFDVSIDYLIGTSDERK
jgi:transcriptional regulator with XRE-family HTH domain